jgi:membrane protein YqaA with SNARE-associated domain
MVQEGIIKSRGTSKIQYLLMLLVIIAMTILVTHYREKLLKLGELGYLGILLSCFFANSTVFLPAPSSVIVFSFSSVFVPIRVAVAGTTGAVLGEHVGYLAGIAGRKTVENNEQGERVKQYLDKYGMLAIFIFAFLPLPLFDLVGVAAGAMKVSYLRFLIPCFVGKFLKMLIYAFAGAGLLPLLRPLIEKLVVH